MPIPTFSTLELKLENHTASINLNRPEKANAMNDAMWQELRQAFVWADRTPGVRVVVLSGNGDNFCAGIDLSLLMSVQAAVKDECLGRQNEKLHALILDLQDCLTALERCRKPVLAAIHGACVGGGLDLVAAADMRYCTEDAFFQIKEIDMGMVADVGSLQRLPKLIGDGRLRELAYTGRRMMGEEAERIGLANNVYANRDSMIMDVLEIAATIVAKSPLAIRGSKEIINYSRDHSVADSLRYVAAWNSGMLVSKDLEAAAMATLTKTTPHFKD
ncbi:crotonase/enoyl-CoA hydratase family protein [Parachitinimonas caeni]|uniref:Crotonase/enoyl-CoA hydratase family protein n=1 Tax=Parachitinimonas caeni TaxID=3031301 RepID=A0ABT7DSA7_9NEIS|nr:crotonase/enoyl-CoA hydratase family protein [Parachitinimonas caeni]MDK2122849.1 crotonase/enoyl-CoA hydratase family protein [Parachitinimonas caeni]